MSVSINPITTKSSRLVDQLHFLFLTDNEDDVTSSSIYGLIFNFKSPIITKFGRIANQHTISLAKS